MSKNDEVLDALRVIEDPDLKRDIVSLGFVKNISISNDDFVQFSIELTTPACPVKDQFRQLAEKAVGELDWVKGVDVNMTAQPVRSRTAPGGAGEKQRNGLVDVRKIIGISSCKGGVGKSTVAINLAFTLMGRDARVGIFDADVYGPSLPTMVKADDTSLRMQEDLIAPVVHESGMKLMSYGFTDAAAAGGAAIMRGPMVSQVVQQLLLGTDWGELDYLVIDLPPGTGDIQLTISQAVPMDASLMVTTPQLISFVDVVKGIRMFDTLDIPVIGVVENMSYFICDGCEKKHFIFGKGASKRIVDEFGILNSFSIPIESAIAKYSDSGVPVVYGEENTEISKLYGEIADRTVRELSRLEYDKEAPEVRYEEGKGILYEKGDTSYVVGSKYLRDNCGCANCVNEFTGEKQLRSSDIPDDIRPLNIYKMGNYAVGIDWSDNHKSIYPYKAIEETAGRQ
jgi:Mrp family chromosome partitioning ATPase/DUF971 family protein